MVLAVVVVTFLLTHVIPGNPVQAIVGEFPVPPSYIAQVKHEFGLDQPLPMQLWLYLVSLGHGNLGFSFVNREPVLPLILQRAGRTLILMIPALTIAAVAGVLIAVLAAVRPGSVVDSGVTLITLFGYSVPVFWLGQILILLFAVHLGWLPPQGMTSLIGSAPPVTAFLDLVQHWILPGFAVSIYYLAVVARIARSSLLDSFRQDYVLTARSIGLSSRRVMFRHVLPNALIPVITVIGYNFGYALTGAILAETVFGWPGLGNLFITSIANRDYPVLEGIFLLSAIAVIVANLATDLTYFWADPRLRRGMGPNA